MSLLAPPPPRALSRSCSVIALAAAILAAGPSLAQQTIDNNNALPPVVVTPPRVTPPPPRRAEVAPAVTRAARPSVRRRQRKPVVAAPRSAPTPPTAASVAVQSPSQVPQPGPSVAVSPTGNVTPTSQIGSSVTVLTQADLEREQRRTVPDALSRVPGLNVVQTGGPGGQTSVFIRGTNSNHVKVIVDGIDVSDPSNPNRSFDFGQLLTNDLARIEVLRGPQSGLYGADAIGGVISIITRKGEGPPKVTFQTEGGSNGTFNQFGTLSGSEGGFNYLFAIQHFRSDHTPVTPRELVPVMPVGYRRNPNSYDNATFTTKLGYDVNDVVSVNYVGRLIDSQLLGTNDIGFPSRPAPYRFTQDDVFSFQRGETVINLADGRFKNVFGVGYTNENSANQAPSLSATVPPTLGNTPIATRNVGLRTKYDYRGDFLLMEGQRFVFGADREDETLSNKLIRPSNINTGGYFQWQQDYGKRVFLVSNVRIDQNDRYGQAVTYRLAPSVIIPGTETTLKGSVGTGFKAPTLYNLYVSLPQFSYFANPNLQPEKSFGWDAGFEQPLEGDRVRFGATYFQNEIKNLVQVTRLPNALPLPISTPENVGRASAYGVESFISFVFSDTLTSQIAYTNTSTRDEINRQELLRRPRHKVSETLRWQPWEKWSLSATANLIGTQVDGNRDFSFPRLRTAPYVTVNMAANYQASDQVNVFARVDNLFDRQVQDPIGFLRPGLSAYAGLRLTN